MTYLLLLNTYVLCDAQLTTILVNFLSVSMHNSYGFIFLLFFFFFYFFFFFLLLSCILCVSVYDVDIK